MEAVIMAGGKGTRLGAIAAEIPKPMVRIAGKPVLQHQIENLTRCGITDIYLVIGHLGQVIKDYFGDGSALGAKIRYIEEEAPLGTAGALFYLKDRIGRDADAFLLLYGDVFLDVDFGRFVRFHKDKKAIATLFVHPNSHPYDSDLVVHDAAGRVIGWDSKQNKRDYDYQNCVNAALYVFSGAVFASFAALGAPVRMDLEKDVLIPMIREGQAVFAYRSTEYVKDMGTPDRLEAVSRDYAAGVCRARNLANPQRCIFLDRDGTINRHVGFITRPEQVELLPGAAEAIKMINQSPYLCIVVTNQPVLARGDCTVQELDAVHRRLETLLGAAGAYIDDLFYCPHHPDKGFPGEVPELKIVCNCRKPAPGLVEAAAARYNIDLPASFMIGDTTQDILMGRRAGLKTVLVKTGEQGKDGKYAAVPHAEGEDLREAVALILNGKVG